MATGYNDPQDNEITNTVVLAWLSENGFTQDEINALGDNAAATDKLYESFLINCDFTAQNPGSELSLTDIAVSNGVVSITVQFARKAPLGAIHGVLNLYGANDLAAGFGRSPIAEESISFGPDDDPSFSIAPTTELVIQTVTATFDTSFVTEKFFKAAIEFPRPDEPWEDQEEEPE